MTLHNYLCTVLNSLFFLENKQQRQKTKTNKKNKTTCYCMIKGSFKGFHILTILAYISLSVRLGYVLWCIRYESTSTRNILHLYTKQEDIATIHIISVTRNNGNSAAPMYIPNCCMLVHINWDSMWNWLKFVCSYKPD